jgi:hypothetical protein
MDHASARIRYPPLIFALQEAAVPFAPGTKMMGCMYGPGHDELLQQDMRNTAALGVQVSATIQVGADLA